MQIQTDERGVVIGWATVGGFEDGIEVDSLPEDIRPSKYIYENGRFIENDQYVDPAEQEACRERIGQLKASLQATDYRALKYAEGFLSEEEYAADKAQRQTWRDEINQLEARVHTIQSQSII